MRSLAIINQKGGVGKTTSAVNLAAALARKGLRVGLIDMDPQAHASLHFGLTLQHDELSIYDVLMRDASMEDIWRPTDENLFVAPSCLDLAAAEVELAGEVGREMILRDKMREDSRTWDYILIDCPPSLGVLTLNALTAVNEVLLTLQPHFLALHGLSKLLQTVDVVRRRLNRDLELAGVAICLFDSGTRLASEVTADVEKFFQEQQAGGGPWAASRCFQSRVRRNIRLAEAPSFSQSIFRYAPYSNGAADYDKLAQEIQTAAPVVGMRAAA